MMQNLPKMPLSPDTMDADPIKQFTRWFAEAEQAELPMHNAMTLATASRAGKPSERRENGALRCLSARKCGWTRAPT